MSDPPSSPYKSKLFNFLNRQTIRVKEQVKRTVRQAKVAATWGVQVVMYPIYLIFQTTRYTSYRFQQSAQETWKRLQPTTEPQHPPESDAPIQQILEAIEQLQLDAAPVGIVPSIDSKLAIPQQISPKELKTSEIVAQEAKTPSIADIAVKLGNRSIFGIASALETRTLVLVTSKNEILDILTPEQQNKLMRRIIWEIAVYKHQWRLWASWGKEFSPKIASRQKAQVLPPIRWFWQTMAWLQTSQLAIAIDLFQESSLIKTNALESSPPLVLPPSMAQILKDLEIPGMAVVEQQLTSLDLAIAKVETYLLSQPSPSNLTVPLPPNQSQIVTNPSDNKIVPRARTNQLSRKNSDKFPLQSLIWAAIDYFFGSNQSRSAKLRSNATTSPQNLDLSLPPNYELDEVDPWLSWTDLFPETPITESPNPQPKTSHLSPSKSRPRPKLSGKPNRTPQLSGRSDLPPQSIWSTIKSFFGIDDSQKLPKNLATAGSDRIQAEENPGNLAAESQNLGESIVTTSSSPSLEYTPNWIETEATPRGYVKHPLQKLLEWLDRIMLSVEEFCERIYQQVKRWFTIR
ncbi:hypothetical protein [Merismopedia glauca]|uniref:Uncharacterized protein n=1 Tax=Merismopedia glauca CCAP 1448/3 TaxID=1296344 RepID=A0A2T1C7W3_9CYAN|nr:hypothetical protein [Merismopedia glauca]PSB04350.1 hypothetical protein C7B64_04595 [Merismopedia glauca CCAP 1448/3]